MAQTFKRKPLSMSELFSLVNRLESQLGYLTDCLGLWKSFRVDISSIKQSENVILVEGSFKCAERSRTVKEGRFTASLDEELNLIEVSLTLTSEG